MQSVIDIVAEVQGTKVIKESHQLKTEQEKRGKGRIPKLPIWAIKTMAPADRMYVDFPPMLGPVMI